MKILIIIAFALVSYCASAQNYLGYTIVEIDNFWSKKESVKRIKETIKEDNSIVGYEVFLDNKDWMYYLFTDSICDFYTFSCIDYSRLNGYIKSLNSKCVRQSENSWVDYSKPQKTVRWELTRDPTMFSFQAFYYD